MNTVLKNSQGCCCFRHSQCCHWSSQHSTLLQVSPIDTVVFKVITLTVYCHCGVTNIHNWLYLLTVMASKHMHASKNCSMSKLLIPLSYQLVVRYKYILRDVSCQVSALLIQ